MKHLKSVVAVLLCILLLSCVATNAVSAEENNSFCLIVCAEGEPVIEPTAISFSEDQTIKQALLSSGIEFEGLEDGFFIYSVNGVGANYSLFYDNGGYDLEVSAGNITALCITDKGASYSPEFLALAVRMMEYRQMTNNVDRYPAARSSYNAALSGLCEGADGATLTELLSDLNSAISDYEEMLDEDRFTVTFNATGQDNELVEGVTIKLTDAYGNVSVSDIAEISVIPGTYDFIVSSGFNRTEGRITINEDTEVSVTIPSKEWFGSVRVIDNGSYVPYEQNLTAHNAVYYIDDIASSLAINPIAARGIPSVNETYLYKVYTDINGESVDQRISWASSTNSLSGLVEPGMKGNTAVLEARYTGSDGFTMIQTYSLDFVRVPTLSSIRVKDSSGADLFNGFSPMTKTYAFSLTCGDYIFEADPFITEGCIISINDNENGASLAIEEGDNIVNITVQHENGQNQVYVLNVTGVQAAFVSFSAPLDTVYEVFTQSGTRLNPSGIDVYTLVPQEHYYYISTKDKYFHTSESFTASDGLTVSIAEPDTRDSLEAFCLYDNSSALIRTEYVPDRSFAIDTHVYSYSVPASAQSLYAQATALNGYAVSAQYYSQVHLTDTSVDIKNAVNSLGSATQLKNALRTSGYSLNITVLLSKSENGVTYSQEYLMELNRILYVSAVSLSLSGDSLQMYDSSGSYPVSFDRDDTGYVIKVQNNVEELSLTVNIPYSFSETNPLGGGYLLETNGETVDVTDRVIARTITLDPSEDEETVTITIRHEDPHHVPTTYTVKVIKLDPVSVIFETNPTDATVFVMNNITGKTIYPKNGTFFLTPGEEHTYTVTRYGYVGTRQTFVAPQEDSAVSVSLVKAQENTTLKEFDADWPYFRADADNNGVVDIKTPISAENTFLSWAVQLGEGYGGGATGCPILVDGYIYVYASNCIFKIDTISGEIVARGEMDRSSSFAINTPTYAEGMIFVGLSNGGVQAFNADTLESLWIYNDPIQGQPDCPIAYYDGYVYTGFWMGEDKDAGYVCLSITDEDPSDPKEEKLATWRFVQKGGFYWAGAYICDEFLLVGTDDGDQGYVKGYANVLSLDTKSGTLIDKLCLNELGDNHFGDLRCSITYDPVTGDYYFNTKGGWFYRLSVNADGTINHDTVRALKLYNYANMLSLTPMSTSSPCIYNGRAYIGVSGTSQFGQYSGHNITVIDLEKMSIAYTVRTQGYPQTSGLLTTAYDERDGTVYVYFLDNMTPGKLRIIRDRPGQTSPEEVVVESYTDKEGIHYYDTAPILFTPSGEQAQFVICSPIADKYGNIYFKNDSACLMCLSNTIESLEVTSGPDKTEYAVGESFDPTGMVITARYSNGTSRDITDYVSYSEEPLTEDDTEFEIRFPHTMYQDRNGEAGVVYDAPVAIVSLRIGDNCSTADGDVNGDGYVDETDVTLIIGHVMGSDPLDDAGRVAADLNGDTYIDENDVTLLIQLVMGH